MVTEKAKHRLRVLAHWEKYGIQSTMDAFCVKKRTLFNWKRSLKEGGGKIESLNPGKREPKTKRQRTWPIEILNEIKRIRWQYPNLGPEKVYPFLLEFCVSKHLECPKPITIKRLIKDLGGLRMFPQKVSHFGWLIFYNTKRVHHAFKNKYSPVQYMLSLQEQVNFSQKCNWRWTYTRALNYLNKNFTIKP